MPKCGRCLVYNPGGIEMPHWILEKEGRMYGRKNSEEAFPVIAVRVHILVLGNDLGSRISHQDH
jgi:hypothetical protein